MRSLKLFDIFNSFTRSDWDKFARFVKSEDAVSPRKYFPFVLEARKAFCASKTGIPDIKRIYTSAYGKDSYKYQTIKNRQSELLKLAERYLVHTALEKDFLKKETYLLSELHERKLLGRYKGLLKKTGAIADSRILDEAMFEKVNSYFITKASYLQSINDPLGGFRAFFRHSEIFISHFLNHVFREGFEYLIQKSYSIKYDFNPVLEFADSIRGDIFFEKLAEQKSGIYLVPVIRYYLYKAFKEPDKSGYIELAKKLYFKNEKLFTDWFKTEAYRTLMSYYLMKINKGESKYFTNLFILHKKKLKQNLLADLMQDTYPANVFREYVIIALRLKKFKWVEKFTEKYSAYIPQNIRADELSLANIRITFAKREFERTLEVINGTRIGNYLHYLDTSRFRLMTYYELGMYEDSFPEIDRIKHYLRNNRTIPKFDSGNTRRFLEKFSALIKIALDPDKKEREVFLLELKNMKEHVPAKEWLLEKARAL